MKRLSAVLAAALIFLSGCGINGQQNFTDTTETTQPVTQDDTRPKAHEVKQEEGRFIYDYANLLTDEQKQELNDYAERLYSEYLINPAVVTADILAEYSPSAYAEYAYNQLYKGMGSGLLILINNDTDSDYIYKSGSCKTHIPQDDQNLAFFIATRDIVSGDYNSAVTELLQLAGLCSKLVFDNAGIFSQTQITEFEKRLESGEKDISVLAVNNSTESTNDQICKNYYDRHYKDRSGYMVMIDIHSKSISVCSAENPPENFETARKSANEEAAKENYAESVKKVIDALDPIFTTTTVTAAETTLPSTETTAAITENAANS